MEVNRGINKSDLEDFINSAITPESQQKLLSQISSVELLCLVLTNAVDDDFSFLIVTALKKLFLNAGNVESFIKAISETQYLQSKIADLQIRITESNNSVKLAISELLVIISDSICDNNFGYFENLELDALLSFLVTDNSLTISTSTSEALIKLVQYYLNGHPPKFFLRDATFDFISKNLTDATEEKTLRLYSFFVSLGEVSPDISRVVTEKGIYDKMFELFDSSDYLVKLNLIIIVERFARCKEGIKYICERGVGLKFASELDNFSYEPTVSIGLLQCIGLLIHEEPDMTCSLFEAANGILPKILTQFLCSNFSTDGYCYSKKNAAITAFGLIGSHSRGFQKLCGFPEIIKAMIKAIDTATQSELASSAIDAWTQVLHNNGEYLQKILQELLTMVFSVTVKPFPEIRKSSYSFIVSALTSYPHCLGSILSSKNFNRLILDANSDSDLSVRLTKFEIIKILDSRKDELEDFFSPQDINMISLVANGGPFYKPTGEFSVAKKFAE